jgi:hypothetical protein
VHSTLTPTVARAMTEDRLQAARGRARRRTASARPPSRPVRQGAAAVVARVARRLDAEAAERVIAA